MNCVQSDKPRGITPQYSYPVPKPCTVQQTKGHHNWQTHSIMQPLAILPPYIHGQATNTNIDSSYISMATTPYIHSLSTSWIHIITLCTIFVLSSHILEHKKLYGNKRQSSPAMENLTIIPVVTIPRPRTW